MTLPIALEIMLYLINSLDTSHNIENLSLHVSIFVIEFKNIKHPYHMAVFFLYFFYLTSYAF
jgi:hypothetical protein